MYLANNTLFDITIVVSLLAIVRSSPTCRYCNRIKHTFRYLKRTIDLGLFYSNHSQLIGYENVGYLSNPH